MGVLIVESSRGSTHTEEIFVENDFKDNKKKKRRSRKSRRTVSGTVCSSVNQISVNASNLANDNTSSNNVVSNGHYQLPKEYSSHHLVLNGHHQLPKEYNGCSSASERMTDENLQKQHSPPHEVKEVIRSNSVPEPPVSEEPVGTVLIARPVDCQARKKCFPPYWPAEAVSKALEKGELARALFRVNAHNRLEAYCKIDGVQTDVLINGVVAQNRAIEGDIVAIVIDPPSLWPRMKGSNETLNNSVLHTNGQADVQACLKGKGKLDSECEHVHLNNNMVFREDDTYFDKESSSGAILDYSYVNGVLDNGYISGHHSSISEARLLGDANESMSSLEKLSTLVSSLPSKRPTGKVVDVIERSLRRDSIVGFLSVKQWIYSRESMKKNARKNRNQPDLNNGYILLTPTDPKFTKMMVPVRNLPGCIKKRLDAGDLTIESDLVAAKIVDWAEDSHIPDACVTEIFGRGSDVEAQIAAILFENAVDASDFSSEVLSCLPHIPWDVPDEELQSRRDLRNLCIFTIDPASATELDDALSVERLSNGVFRVGVHIADVSYFVLPDRALDIDAQIRSTSVYLLRRKLPMLPSMLSDNLASLNPGVDRLAFTIFWDINSAGEVLDHWIGHTVIQSCSKLSYEHAQKIIDGSFDFQDSSSKMTKDWPELYGPFEWCDVIKSVKCLHEISKMLRENRFRGGALSLESPKIVFLFDEEGVPYDSVLSESSNSNFLVEEFMLLANRTAAEVITRAYPSCALLRRHPEPNLRKLREFEAFCNKHGLKLDISSSAHLHHSLEHIRGELKNDSVLFDILMSYAARPMQLAAYFCSGDLDASDRGHYALAVPLYTHFTSPLRRYPDIVVHRTLAAALEAEDFYLKRKRMAQNRTEEGTSRSRCFTGTCFEKEELESAEAQEALLASAAKHRVPCTETLTEVAAHCNGKRLASRHVKDATDKLYMWVLLRKKEMLYSEARVLGLGPRFMSIYISKLAVERRIYYDEVEGLTVEWLDATSTLVLSQSTPKRSSRRSSPGKFRTLEEIALIVNPADLKPEMNLPGDFGGDNAEVHRCEPAFFPLTINLLSTIPVALHAVGGDDGPLDIVARLYAGSYFN